MCLTKIWYRKNIATREGASITIFRQMVLSLSSESSRRGIFLCFRKFGVSKKLCLRREYNDFLQEICCLTVAKNFVGEPFNVSLNSGIENFVLEKVVSRFSIGNLSSQSTEKLRR